MSSATIAGTISFPVVTDGATSSVIIGAPSVTSSSTSGVGVSYTEGGVTTLMVGTSAPTSLPMGTVASAAVFYVGTNNPVNLILNGGAETITLGANGGILLFNTSITEATVQATTTPANVSFVVLGD